jgi:hypothetical protein
MKKRQNFGLASANGCIDAIGGSDGKNPLNSHYKILILHKINGKLPKH